MQSKFKELIRDNIDFQENIFFVCLLDAAGRSSLARSFSLTNKSKTEVDSII